MRDRHRLPKLTTPHTSLRLLVEYPIHIEVKSSQVLTPKKGRALIGAANIEVWSRPGVQRVSIAQTDRRLRATPGKHNRLHSRSNSARLIPIADPTVRAISIGERIEHALKLQSRRHRQLRDLVD